MQRRDARRLREHGYAIDEIALRTDLPEATLARWFRDDDAAARRAAAAHAPIDLIGFVDAEHREMLTTLNRMAAAAEARSDTRSTLEILRERRHLVREISEHSSKRGAYNIPLLSKDNAASLEEDDDLNLSNIARKFVKDMFMEGEVADQDTMADTLAAAGHILPDDDGDDDPAPVYVTA